ncbi:hypothetical protein [Endozoicomonas sp. 8E]|uniref:hypothetical protein n=1 Tax=Endozoicomonas sp. 8E TaxID=3035692 RepID=UPI002938E8DA|nr:hypothetical protein [Endozoicomonas sp. 8E]WOG27054.1 hypothetical protein P6910_21265 [Endozoicomonas sp. 8E]
MPDSLSEIADKNSYAGSTSPPDKKRQKLYGSAVATTLFYSITWQWLYVTNLLTGFELTVKDATLSTFPYSWRLSEAVIVLGWLLKSYWNPDSPILKPTEQLNLIEQQEVTSMLTQRESSFATTIAVLGSGYDQTQDRPSEPPAHQAPQTTTRTKGHLTHLPNYDSGEDNRDPQQHSHTLGLTCFVHPCHGVCRLRSASDGRGPDDWPLDFEENSTGLTGATPGQSSCSHSANQHCNSCMGYFKSEEVPDSQEKSLLELLNDCSGIQHLLDSDPLSELLTYDIGGNPADGIDSVDGVAQDEATCSTGSAKVFHHELRMPGNLTPTADFAANNDSLYLLSLLGEIGVSISHSETLVVTSESSHSNQCQTDFCQTGTVESESDQKIRDHSNQMTYDVNIVREGGQLRPCGAVRKNAQSLRSHKGSHQTGKRTCNMTVIGEDGQPHTCGTVWPNAKTLYNHKRSFHSGKKTCQRTLVGKDGQPRPCEKVCKSATALSDHITRSHSGQKTCYLTLVTKDGLQYPCGAVCNSAAALSDHKRRCHGEQHTCDATVVRKDGLSQLCGKLYNNIGALRRHKSANHSGQKTCDLTEVKEDGQRRPCGLVCKNIQALRDHKRKHHTGPQICDLTVIGINGESQPCRKVCSSSKSLADHRRRKHLKRKSVTIKQNPDQDL